MLERRKLAILAVFVVAVIAAGIFVGPMLLNLELVKTGPLYPNAMANEPRLGAAYYNADWNDVQGTPTIVVSPIYLDPNLSTLTFNYLKASDFRAAMSSTATITGIAVTLQAADSNCHDITGDLLVQMGPGKRMGDQRDITLCPTQGGASLGGSSDTWDMTLSGSDVSSSSFAIWVTLNAQILPRVTIAQMNAYFTINTLAVTFYTNSGGAQTYSLSLNLNPASGKSTTAIVGVVSSSPIQSTVKLDLQVRRAGTSVWQTLFSETTDALGSATWGWTPQQYGMSTDGTYIYRVISEDGTVSSDQVSYIQSDNPITPPPPTNWWDWIVANSSTLAIILVVATVIVVFVGVYFYRRRN